MIYLILPLNRSIQKFFRFLNDVRTCSRSEFFASEFKNIFDDFQFSDTRMNSTFHFVSKLRIINRQIRNRYIWNIKCPKFHWILSIFNLGNLGSAGGKYFIKIIFDIKIEIGILEILDVPNFNKLWAFIIWGIFWA